MKKLIDINKNNIDVEHICCAISDKKCNQGYTLKKDWLKNEFKNGYIFKRIDDRAKVFIEYGPAETAWIPITAANYFNINCFWVSGKYKFNGYGKELLKLVIDDAYKNEKTGIVTVVGTKKYHFMSDTKWFIKQGFEECDTLPSGFSLLIKKLKNNSVNPFFNNTTKTGFCEIKNGIVVYYSNRCPFTEYYVNNLMTDTAKKRNLNLSIFKINSIQDAQSCPSPATIFSLFYNGKFITTDIGACMDNRFDIILKKYKT